MNPKKLLEQYYDDVVLLFREEGSKEVVRSEISCLLDFCRKNEANVLRSYSFSDDDFREVVTNLEGLKFDYILMSRKNRVPKADLDWLKDYCEEKGVVVRFGLDDPFVCFRSSDAEFGPFICESEDDSGFEFHEIPAEVEEPKETSGEGTTEAKPRGSHCGRYKSFCWVQDIPQNINRIKVDGKNATVIVSFEDVLDCANSGMSLDQTAGKLGVSSSTLKNNLTSIGKYGEFQAAYNRNRPEPQSEPANNGENRPAKQIAETCDLIESEVKSFMNGLIAHVNKTAAPKASPTTYEKDGWVRTVTVDFPMLTITGARNVVKVIHDDGCLDRDIWTSRNGEWSLKAYRLSLSTSSGKVYSETGLVNRVKDARLVPPEDFTAYFRDGLVYDRVMDLVLDYEDGYQERIPVIDDVPVNARRGVA